jgi:hypothetical protein
MIGIRFYKTLLLIVPSIILGPLSSAAETLNSEATATKASCNRAILVRSVHRKGQHNGYAVDVHYPRFLGEPETVVAELNRQARHVVDMNIPTDPSPIGNYIYRCDYKVVSLTPHLVSVDFIFSDNVGAQGGLRHAPFNFQIGPVVRELRLGDLFGKHPKYGALSNVCQAKLTQKFGADLSMSSNPLFSYDDLSDFNFDDRCITFTFAEGFVAAVAVGCPSICIEYDSIKKLLSHASPLYNYAGNYDR